jgi:hypothetical protein
LVVFVSKRAVTLTAFVNVPVALDGKVALMMNVKLAPDLMVTTSLMLPIPVKLAHVD